MHSAREPYHHRRWMWAVLALAIAVRVFALADKPFWRDEAWVAEQVASPLSAGLAQPRAVPIGFVAVTQALGALPLAPEIAYRLLPLVTGIALLPLLGALAAALGATPPVPLVVMWLAAGMPALVYYSRELKSYGLDALLAALLPLLALHFFGRAAGQPQRRPAIAGAILLVVLAAAPWITFGALFAIAAVLAWGWLAWWWRATPSARCWWGLASAVYVASFGLAYRVTLGAQTDNPRLRTAWQGHLLQEVSPSLLAQTATAVERYASIAVTYVFPTVWPLAVPLLLIGLLTWPRAWRGYVAWLCLATAAIAVVAAVADRYLLAAGRLLLFAAPALLLCAAAGLSSTARRLSPRRGPTVAVAAAAALALIWSGLAVAHRLPPYHNDRNDYFYYDILHDVPALLDAAGSIIPPGEPLYVAQYASRPFAWYAHGRFAAAKVCREPCNPNDTAGWWLESWHGRAWMIVVDDENGLVAEQLTRHGAVATTRLKTRGVELWEVHR
ncbi:MAG: hypothetical protein ABI629_20570 [bacterium]